MECKNCNESLSGQEKFCSNCGQKNIDKLNLKHILSAFIDDFFNVDSKLVLTLKYLLLRPGLLSKEYLEGKRVSYVPPIRLYLVLSVIYFFLISVVDIKTVDNSGVDIDETANQETTFSFGNVDSTVVDSVTPSESNFSFNDQEIGNLLPIDMAREMYHKGTLDHHLDSITEGQGFFGYVQRQVMKANVRGEGFFDIVFNQVSLFLLLFIPLLALIYATCFSRNKYGYVGHLIFNLHFNSFIILLLCINQLLGLFILPELMSTIWTYLMIFVPQIYLILAVMTFYERKWWAALYKYIFLFIGYFALSILFIAFVFASSFMLS